MESLIEAISTLDLDSKEKLLALLERQIFAAEETSYEEDPQTIAEIKAVQTEYEAGEYITFNQYLENRSKQALSNARKTPPVGCVTLTPLI